MINLNIDLLNYKRIHFIGIGGVSMSGLAKILISQNCNVSGSDNMDSDTTKELVSLGAKIFIGHSDKNISIPDLIIYTDAISSDNPELVYANSLDIPVLDRGTFLGQLMKTYSQSIAVAGTHGKTSTTGVLSHIFSESHFDPTILIGGYLKQLHGNIRISSKKNLLITEACEYKGNILKFFPSIGIILNIDADHLDYYKSLSEIVDTFKEFANSIPKEGYLVINSDDPNSKTVIGDCICNIVTFGIKTQSKYQAVDIQFNADGKTQFTLLVNGTQKYNVNLNITGNHNIYNVLAGIAAAHSSGLDIEYAISQVLEFTGANRRLDFKGSFNGTDVIDDYAHHPTEIKATLSALKNLNYKNIFCVFQPHTYTRTKSLLDEFSLSFFDADKVIITNIYAAREKDTGIVHSKHLVDKLLEKKVDVLLIEDFKDIENYLLENVKSGDLIVTMGAGNVFEIGENLI